MRRRTLLTALPIASLRPGSDSAWAQALPAVRIGVLWDRSGAGAVTSGLDQIVAARLGVDDFGQFSRGYPIELLDAEFERRPDQATDIARRWFDQEGFAAIVDLPSTSAAIQVQNLARSRGRTVLNTSSFSTALTGSACSPTATHWCEDTRALTMAMTLGLAAEEVRTWFLVAPDDLTGWAFLADATAAIELTGGRVIGIARHPPEAGTFTSPLVRARDSTAAAVGLCAVGSSLTTQIKEGRSLGLFEKGKAVCA
jgi:branched-chain amino acid transport system substrate-binding protein